ncbi:MAG: hypothetical protein J7K87_02255 [Candidatus Aenigmarchaeota archaeon]|nr:hypothetical protein [Candidatus Aenigmarchaeota archaeon]
MNMSKKGITPVIAMILLILIVVALGGVFAAWTMRTWQAVQESGTQQIKQTTESFQKGLIIDNIDCSDGTSPAWVYVRNTGSVAISVDEISLYINDTLYDASWYNSTGSEITKIEPGMLGKANFTGINRITGPVRVSVGSGIQDSSNKCIPS